MDYLPTHSSQSLSLLAVFPDRCERCEDPEAPRRWPKTPNEVSSSNSDLFTWWRLAVCQHPRIKWSVWHDGHMGWAVWLRCLHESVRGGRGRCPAVPSTRRHICTSRLKRSLPPFLHPSCRPALPRQRPCLFTHVSNVLFSSRLDLTLCLRLFFSLAFTS